MSEISCQDPECPDFGDPSFGEGTCPAGHASTRVQLERAVARTRSLAEALMKFNGIEKRVGEQMIKMLDEVLR